MRAADSTRTNGSARISHSEFAIDKQRIVGDPRVPDTSRRSEICDRGIVSDMQASE
jgi:hypothetical protein